MQKQKLHLEQKISRERVLALQLPQLSAKIVILIKPHGKLNIGEIETITKANRNTLKNHLAKLVQMKTLLRLGKGKATWYTLS